MFHQLTTPIGNSLAPSVLVAALPVLTVVISLGVSGHGDDDRRALLAALVLAQQYLIPGIIPGGG